jgi:hypothetical protein
VAVAAGAAIAAGAVGAESPGRVMDIHTTVRGPPPSDRARPRPSLPGAALMIAPAPSPP